MKYLNRIVFVMALLLAGAQAAFASPCQVPIADTGAQLIADINACLSTGVFDASSLTTGTLPPARMPALTGDCTSSVGTVVLTCAKAGGTPFAASATTDTTDAGNINKGTLAAAQLPALTGDTTSAGNTSVTTTNFVKNGKTPVDTTQGVNALAAATGDYSMGGHLVSNLGPYFFRSITIFTDANGPTAAGTFYFSVFGTHNASEGAVNTRVPVNATLRNLYCTDTGPPGTGNSDTFTLRVAGGSTALTCPITDGNTQCSDVAHSGTITAGQALTIQDVTVGTPGARPISCQFEEDL